MKMNTIPFTESDPSGFLAHLARLIVERKLSQVHVQEVDPHTILVMAYRPGSLYILGQVDPRKLPMTVLDTEVRRASPSQTPPGYPCSYVSVTGDGDARLGILTISVTGNPPQIFLGPATPF